MRHHWFHYTPSNDKLSLVTSPLLRARVLAALHSAPAILGSGGPRLLVYSHARAALEDRLERVSRPPPHSSSTLDSTPMRRSSRAFCNWAMHYPATPSSTPVSTTVRVRHALRRACDARSHSDVRVMCPTPQALLTESDGLRGESSVFVTVESVYSMDGTVAPLRAILDAIERGIARG